MKAIITAIFFLTMMGGGLKSQTERSVTEAHGLSVGTKAPLFSANDADSYTFFLGDALEKGPVVIIFYRGYWCPVCDRHLGILQDSLKFIMDKGATVIAISPEKPEYLDKMAEKTGAEFALLYDEGYKISDAYDVTFTPSPFRLFTYNTFAGADLKDTHSDDSQRLPIPATYVVDRKGNITWRQFDPDYKNRSTVADILKALDDIR